MKPGPVTKPDKENTLKLKKKEKRMMMTLSCW